MCVYLSNLLQLTILNCEAHCWIWYCFSLLYFQCCKNYLREYMRTGLSFSVSKHYTINFVAIIFAFNKKHNNSKTGPFTLCKCVCSSVYARTACSCTTSRLNYNWIFVFVFLLEFRSTFLFLLVHQLKYFKYLLLSIPWN